MKQYRYRLGRIVLTCPECGRKTFKPYIDLATDEIVHTSCGRCNREVNCRYHLRPSEFFRLNPGSSKPLSRTLFAGVPGDSTPSFIPKTVFESEWRPPMTDGDNLFRFLKGIYGDWSVRRIFTRFYVSHHPYCGGSSAFWLRDSDLNIRSAKIMTYDPETGRRVKVGGTSRVCYYHALKNNSNFKYRACFFGEWQAHFYFQATILVVESEKTALILAIELENIGLLGHYTVIATGGASGLAIDSVQMSDKYYRAHIFIGRRLILIPDADMVEKWREYAGELKEYAESVALVDVRKSPWCLEGSEDIADFLIRRRRRHIRQNLSSAG